MLMIGSESVDNEHKLKGFVERLKWCCVCACDLHSFGLCNNIL